MSCPLLLLKPRLPSRPSNFTQLKLMVRKIILFCLFSMVLMGTSFGTSYFVSPSGNDSNSGTDMANALLTLQEGADRVVAGDSVLVADGNYAGFDCRTTGTEINPIVFIALGPSVIIDQENPVTTDGINIENANWIEVNGFNVISMDRNGIRLVNADNCTVRNCFCDDNFERGIFTGFTDFLLLEYNVCNNSIDEHGIYVSNSSDNAIIRYNSCSGNNASGIQINADASLGGDGVSTGCEIYGNILFENGQSGGAAINLDGAVGTFIYNNLLYENHASGIALFQIDAAAPSSGAIIIHNTIINAADGRWCILIVDGSTDVSIYNNILINQHSFRGSIALDPDSESGFESDYNIVIDRLSNQGDGTSFPLSTWQGFGYDLNSSLADPLADIFEDPTGENYHLTSESQAVDAGSAALSMGVDTDIEGVLRPQGPEHDIGAYEFDDIVLAFGNNNELRRPGKMQPGVFSKGGKLEVTRDEDGSVFALHDLSGKNVIQSDLVQGNNVFSLAALPCGWYLGFIYREGMVREKMWIYHCP